MKYGSRDLDLRAPSMIFTNANRMVNQVNWISTGFYAKEAISYSDKTIKEAPQSLWGFTNPIDCCIKNTPTRSRKDQLTRHRVQLAEYSQSPPVHQSPSQHAPSQPYRQQSVRIPAQRAHPLSPDVAPLTEPVRSHIPQHTSSVNAVDSRLRNTLNPLPLSIAFVVHTLSALFANRAYESLHNARPPVSPAVTPVTEPRSQSFFWTRISYKSTRVSKLEMKGVAWENVSSRAVKRSLRNEGALAKQLSLKGEAHKANMARLDKAASMKIFQENNQGLMPDTVDLHGLFVLEAKMYFGNCCSKGSGLWRIVTFV
ncbi:hypothetical protein F4604DRAFT_1914839 [Suillus subluteus]|nr:hypothetical protein F4604DRAFT_1914839 [Suillus subluteus]